MVLEPYMTNNHVNNMVCMTMSNTKSGEFISIDFIILFQFEKWNNFLSLLENVLERVGTQNK